MTKNLFKEYFLNFFFSPSGYHSFDSGQRAFRAKRSTRRMLWPHAKAPEVRRTSLAPSRPDCRRGGEAL